MLNSILIYYLASVVVPVSILNRIERIISTFLWNANGEARTHWVSWENICRPVVKGGLGTQGFKQVRESLHAKLMWTVMWDDFLWASFARCKYYVGNIGTIPSNGSPLWRSIASHWPRLMSLSRWIIGDGSISFWTTNWCGEILEGPLPCDQTLTMAKARANCRRDVSLASC